jgi:HK97 gp10 family phage protein|tara:strand:- start:4145 stop:4564 length:420 start_codon:yes stop_codon:yes gene_type:complete
MAKVSLRIVRKSRHRAVLSEYKKNVTTYLVRAGNLVLNTAKTSIQSGNKSGVMRPSGTRSSAAGEPPQADTGYLAQNIVLAIDSDGMGVGVESRAEYSVFLEFGTSKMAARPFMFPALEQNKKKIRRIANEMIKANVNT